MKNRIIISFYLLFQFTFFINHIFAQVNSDTTSKIMFNQVITSEDFNKGVMYDPFQLISGQALGVSLTKKGSDPNVFNSTIIRGISSEFSSGALFIIDGVYRATPEFILPDNIESVEIIKDAASTAKYGSQGMNGVIIIKTKSYKGDKKISLCFNSGISFNSPYRKLDILSASKYRSIISDDDLVFFVDGGANTDWQDEIFRNTISQKYNLAISGKLKSTGYLISFFNQNNIGIVLGSDWKNTGMNVRLTHSALKNRLNFIAAVYYTNTTGDMLPDYTNLQNRSRNFFLQAFTRNPTDPVFENDKKTFYESSRIFNYYNPLSIINNITNTNESKNINLNFSTKYKISEELDFDLNLGCILLNNDLNYSQSIDAYWGTGNEYSLATTNDNKNFNLEAILNYSKNFIQNHHVNFSIEYAGRQQKDEHSVYFSSVDSISDYYKKSQQIHGLIGHFEYNFKNRYFINAIINNEYYKLLIRNNNPQKDPVKRNNQFPAVTMGWKLNNEPFLNQYSFISDLTLKGGYGVTGNTQGDYYIFSQYFVDSKGIDMEKSREFSLGLNIGLLKNRVNGSLTLYNRNVKNAITPISVPSPPNPFNYYYGNGAWYRNKGFELSIETVPVTKNNIKWSTSLWLFRNYNELVSNKLVNAIKFQTGIFEYNGDRCTQIIQTGSPSRVFYLPVFLGQDTENGYPIFYSENGGFTENIDNAKKEIMGQPVPKFEVGWINSVQFFRAFDLNFIFRYAGGYKIYNATRMFLSRGTSIPSENVSSEGVKNYTNGYYTVPLSSIYLEDASFLRLENITISYTFKFKKNNWGDNVNFYLGADNLFTITDFTGFDPAGYNNGVDYFDVYPLARSFKFGVKLTL